MLLLIYYQEDFSISKKDLLFTLTSKGHNGRDLRDTIEKVLPTDGMIEIDDAGTIKLKNKGINTVEGLLDSGEWGQEIMYARYLMNQGEDADNSSFVNNIMDLSKKELQEEFDFKLDNSIKYFSDNALKKILRRDILDAYKCLKYQLWKPAIILSAGVIEEIFLIKTKEQTKEKIGVAFSKTEFCGGKFNWKFYQLVAVVEQLEIFHTSLTELSEIVRHFRNFVHIDTELNEKKEFDVNDAQIAFRTMIKILKELN